MRRDAFTLVEILVVIGIVIILVALLLPVILRIRESAYQYYCMNNLHVLGKSHHAYAMDYNGGIVPFIRGSVQYKSIEWYSALEPYGKDILGDDEWGSTKAFWIQCPKYKPAYNAYAQNDSIGFMWWWAKRTFPVNFSQIPNPSIVALMAENNTMDFNYTIKDNLGIDYGQSNARFYPTAHFGEKSKWGRWINGYGNLLFCDGHAESIYYKNNWLSMANLRVKRD
jgi:prepilin-type processing-associated H-X9-DG protein